MEGNYSLPEDKRQAIKSMALYWQELRTREDGDRIRGEEIYHVVRTLGPDTIFRALEAFANQ